MSRTASIVLAIACSVGLAATVVAQSGRARSVSHPPDPPPSAPDASAPATPEKKAAPRAAPVAVDAHYDTKYAGGTVAFEKDAKTRITIKDGLITLSTKNATFEFPAAKVTEMSYGQNVRQRTAEAIGVGVLVPGLGGIIGNSKSRAHYVEILWDLPPNGGVALRVDKDDYRGLIAALEGSTGVKVQIEAQPGPIDWP